MKIEKDLISSTPFLMYRKNIKFINGASVWTGKQKMNFVIASILLITFAVVIFVLGYTVYFGIENVWNSSNLAMVIISLLFLASLMTFFSAGFFKNRAINKSGTLITGKVIDFKILDGETITIKVKYNFQSPNNELIFGESESALCYSTHYVKKISVGDAVVVQYLDENNFDLL